MSRHPKRVNVERLSIEMRDKMLKSGMESGASASYDRLEAFLASI